MQMLLCRSRRQSWAWASAALVVLVACGCSLLAAPAALAANFTWSGGGTTSADAWSNVANWEGGSTPSGAIGTLTFPALTSAACTAEPPTATCYTSNNDLSGLNVNEIVLADNAPYAITGNGITLGAGGIKGSASGSYHGFFSVEVARLTVPLTLSAPQTWSISGGNPYSDFAVGGNVSGSDTLGINLSNSIFLAESDFEVGALTVTGKGYVYLGFLSVPGSLNSSDDNPVSFGNETTLEVHGVSVAVGPLTDAGGISLGEVNDIGESSKASTFTVHGGLTFSSTTSFQPTINYPGTVAGTDYSQLSASGNVNLGGAQLGLQDGESLGEIRGCEELTPGNVDTIVTTTGSLTGTFNGIPDGTTVPVDCQGEIGTAPTARINYTAHAVTATIETAGSGAKEAKEREEAKKKVEEEAANKKTEESGHSGGGGSSSTGSTPSTGTTSTTSTPTGGSTGSSGGSTPATISSVQIAALLGQQLVPSGKTATIPALLKSGGLTMSFKVLEAGTLSVQWYEVPSGAKLAKHTKAKPVLVASGLMSFPAAGTGKVRVRLTAAGKRLLRHTKRLKLEAKGTFAAHGKEAIRTMKELTLRG